MVKKTSYFMFCLGVFFFGSAYADIVPSNIMSAALWDTMAQVEQTEGKEIIHTVNNETFLEIDSISCVFEQYNACSFFTVVNGERKLIVNTDQAALFMDILSKAGVWVDEENARMDVERLYCKKEADLISCKITLPVTNQTLKF